MVDFSKVESCDWRVSSYFSIVNSNDNTEDIAVIHQDIDVLYAGVVYLSKNLDINSGTSLYKKENENYVEEYEFKNEFNKMINDKFINKNKPPNKGIFFLCIFLSKSGLS